MKRNVIKNLEEYRDGIKKGDFPKRTQLTVNELFELVKYAKTELEEVGGEDALYNAVMVAWESGYMTGYKRGKRSKTDAEA